MQVAININQNKDAYCLENIRKKDCGSLRIGTDKGIRAYDTSGEFHISVRWASVLLRRPL